MEIEILFFVSLATEQKFVRRVKRERLRSHFRA